MRSSLLAILVGVACLVGCTKPKVSSSQNGPRGTPSMHRGAVDAPAMLTAEEAELPEEEPVIGVVVAGKARAYSVKGLSSIRSHVVNDLVDDVPVSVTYCDKQDCSRSFTSSERGNPLPLTVGGFMDDSMLLKYEGKMYRQDTGAAESPNVWTLPFSSVPHERTTWGKWRTKHPKTMVFVGLPLVSPPL